MFSVHKAEILAPAGSFDAVTAAVRCGADAVYLGAKSFSARAGAKNFDRVELSDTVAFCHERNAKVHLTVNTAIYNDELKSVSELIEFAALTGVDALIISDLGVLKLAKNICPQMPLHASTQMGIASPDGALAAKEMGFSRVVLARELSRREIEEIAALKSVETEVFVHGALCMCISGQCYMSAFLGGRSGNRGRCAQPCRLDFSLENSDAKNVLSLKDMSLYKHINSLCDAGVTSFKIEGRMKRPEYVAAAVSLINASMQGKNTEEILSLSREIFSRSGFTDGYFCEDIGRKMFGYRQKDDVENTKDAIPQLHGLYRREMPRVKIDARIFEENGGLILEFSDDDGNVAISDRVECEKKKSDKTDMLKQISRLGSTPFYINEFKLETDELSLSPSQLNAMRRTAAERLSEMRKNVKPKKVFPFEIKESKIRPIGSDVKIYARCETPEQAEAVFEKCDGIILPADKLVNAKFNFLTEKIIAELDRAVFSKDKYTQTLFLKLKECGINKVCVQNYSQIFPARENGFEIMTGAFMNLYNSLAAETLYELGVKSATASFEIGTSKFRHLDFKGNLGLPVYGYLPLMISRACPVKAQIGCKNCRGQGGKLVDRKGVEFNVVCRKNACEILNSVPLCANLECEDFYRADFFEAYFTSESPDKCLRIINDIKNGRITECDKFTRGLYKNGVL